MEERQGRGFHISRFISTTFPSLLLLAGANGILKFESMGFCLRLSTLNGEESMENVERQGIMEKNPTGADFLFYSSFLFPFFILCLFPSGRMGRPHYDD